MKLYHVFTLAASVIIGFSSCKAHAENPNSIGTHPYNGVYTGDYNSRIAFPIGGLGTGMYCLEGTGFFSHMSIRHKPDIYNEPGMFAAIHVKGVENGAKVLEGPVAEWRKFGSPLSGLGGPGGG